MAVNQLNKKAYPVSKPDMFILRHFPEALFCVRTKSHLFIIDRKIKKIKDECLSYMAFDINGEMFTGFFTNEEVL